MKNRRSLVAANWKMHKTVGETVSFLVALQERIEPYEDREVVVAPPFTALAAARQAMEGRKIKLSAQNCHWEEKGAFTGEVSPAMLKDLGCEYVIVGHSERRHLFRETDEIVQKKTASVFAHGMVPILCVGEVLDEREAGRTFPVVNHQLERALDGLGSRFVPALVLAYEPVWAIGTGKTATPDQAQEVHSFLREKLSALFDKTIANKIRILYGGSVKPDNVDALMAQPDVDGLLVGGAGLEVDSFQRIVQYRIPGE